MVDGNRIELSLHSLCFRDGHDATRFADVSVGHRLAKATDDARIDGRGYLRIQKSALKRSERGDAAGVTRSAVRERDPFPAEEADRL